MHMFDKKTIKNVCGALIRIFGLSYAIREVILPKKITILYYHRPAPDTLRSHLLYLMKRYTIISLDALIDAMR